MRQRTWPIVVLLLLSSGHSFAQGCADKLTENSPVKDVIACLKEQQATVGALKGNLSVWSGDAPAVGNAVGSGDPRSATVCPPNYYAAGVNWWGAPGNIHYCIGCLMGIQVICRKLNVQ